MQRMSAREAKNSFGRLIDLARAEPVAIEKFRRPVVVMVSIEEYERLIGKAAKKQSSKAPQKVM